jgi:squalene-hopene/tetraprenyl-beta-curcumene cyclase
MAPPSGVLPASLRARVQSARATAVAELLAARTASGYWRGELSSSALSTATAITALAIVDRNRSPAFELAISKGLAWLATNVNPDGGWGDTTQSVSNLSTTTLAWAALRAVSEAQQRYDPVLDRAELWLKQKIGGKPNGEYRNTNSETRTSSSGGIEIPALVEALLGRYGKDRTFSVPILTHCALAGQLGAGPAAWKWVRPLPFELAALPHQTFAALRLPVVSYALPALIAIGQARHFHRPSRNPLVRWLRHWARQPTLRKLESIQPSSGGFLEATPLTSFVVMSLAGSGQVDHPVTERGVKFLISSQQSDGSWAIDSDLATWVTTLSVNALADSSSSLDSAGARQIGQWLLRQQFRAEHPYTHAAAGGWAWTDLPGGVPDADDTAGALRALVRLQEIDPWLRAEALTSLRLGARWLVGLQNRDGGIPTFCRGWGALPFDRSSADISAHAVRAWLSVYPFLEAEAQARVNGALQRALRFLGAAQRPDGSWPALWFGNQFAPGEENLVYGTARVTEALASLAGRPGCEAAARLTLKGLVWLRRARNPDGGWGGPAGGPSSIEETSLALEALVTAADLSEPNVVGEIAAAATWLAAQVESGLWTKPAPIGLYFARLWYYEKLYPQIFTTGALGKLCR